MTFSTARLGRYRLQDAKHDLIAAIVVTAITIPQSLGFAVIAGLPPITGLYTAAFGPIVYGLLAGSRRLIVGADSATAALIASGAVLIAQSGTVGYVNAVGVLTLLTALLLLIFAVLRLGFLADLISRPVMIGFIAGVGVQLVIAQLPVMLGISAGGTIWTQLGTLTTQLSHVNGMTMTISVLVIGIMIIVARSRLPAEVIGLLLATLFAAVFHVDTYGVQLVGALPHQLPQLVELDISSTMLMTLLPAALSIAVVILAQSSAVSRHLSALHDEQPKLNQELVALGAANAISALTHGFAVNGSPPRSSAAEFAGARTQVTNIFVGLMVIALFVGAGGLFAYIPAAALAAIVAVIGVRLIRLRELLHLWEVYRAEFFVASVALIGTVLFGVLQGVVIAVVVSLMERLSRQYRPHDDILLRDGTLSAWARERLGAQLGDAHPPRHVLVYSFDSSLFFENIHYFVGRIRRAIDGAEQKVAHVIIDAGAIDTIDYTAVQELLALHDQLAVRHATLGFAHVSPGLLHQLDEFGVVDAIGDGRIFPTLAAALQTHLTTHEVHEASPTPRVAAG